MKKLMVIVSLILFGPSTIYGQNVNKYPFTASAQSNDIKKTRVMENYGKIPLAFTKNSGQLDSRVKFTTRGNGATMFFTPEGTTFLLSSETDKSRVRSSVEESDESDKSPERKYEYFSLKKHFVNSNPDPEIFGEERLPWETNSFIGNDPSKWRTNIPNHAKVRLENIYEGIDLVYYGNQSNIKYDFVVQPGADVGQILLKYDFGITDDCGLSVNEKDELEVHTPLGDLIERKPYCYQIINGNEIEVEAFYKIDDINENSFHFSIPSYNTDYPLIIDPELAYSTFLGGTGDDYGQVITADNSGNAYVTRYSPSADFPTTTGAYDESQNGGWDVYVTKLNASGNSLVFSTFVGGNANDDCYGITLDNDANVYITGNTSSTDFPTTTGAYRESYVEGVFVTKLNASGNALVYSTFIGEGRGTGIAVDGSGNAYISGVTTYSVFPTTSGAFDESYNGDDDVFVVKLNPSGSSLIYSTFLGGTGRDIGNDIAIDASGNAYVTGIAGSTEFATTAGAFDESHNGGYNVYVTKLNSSGSGLAFSTFLGEGWGTGISVDGAGNTYVTGYTNSVDFPTTSGAYDESHNGGSDAVVTKLNSSGNALVYSTFIGGNSGEETGRISIDSEGDAFIVGTTSSTDFPVTAGAFDESHNGSGDVYISKLNQNGTTLEYSTFFGGNTGDAGTGLCLDDSGNVYVTGYTNSADLPVTTGAFDESLNGGGSDSFVGKFSGLAAPLPPEITVVPTELDIGNVTVESSGSAAFTIINNGGATLTVSSITSHNDPPFSVSPSSASIAPSDSQVVTVTFSPTSVGEQSATLTITSNDPDEETITVNVSSAGFLGVNEGYGDYFLVPAGEFQMGDNFNEGEAHELPVHTVYLDSFYIGEYEITNYEYKRFMDDGGYTNSAYWTVGGFGSYGSEPSYWNNSTYRGGGIPGNENFPVVGVSWYESMAYCSWLSAKTGEKYRLPTEAEWEKAARGTDQRRYPWGNNIDGSYANYSNSGDSYDNGMTPVGYYDGSIHGSFSTNDNSSPYGAYDMAGNVYEWVSDWYSANYYADSPSNNPTGPASGSGRVIRGGSWNSLPWEGLRSTFRPAGHPPNNTFNYLGFRCVRVPPAPEITVSIDSLNIGNVVVDSSGTGTFTISNVGTATLEVSSIVSSNPVFSVSPASPTIAAGENQVVTVTFSPTSVGEQSATITVTSNDLDKETVTVIISGNGAETGTVTDIDGNTYQTIKIGDQWWTAENLKVTHYRNGDAIPNVTGDSEWIGLSSGAYSAYNNDESNATVYGYLYNWYAVDDSRGLAPDGWHVPTDDDWKVLEMYLGMSQSEVDGVDWRGTDEGGKLKEAGTTHWGSPNTGATNESGFTALPGGWRHGSNGSFNSIGLNASFWSSTESSSTHAWRPYLSYSYSGVNRYYDYKQHGFSVRCVRDTTLPPPLPPTLSSPSDGATGVSIPPTLSWNASSGATSYTLQVSENNDLSSPVFDSDVGNVTSKEISGLSGVTTYYWRVNASNSAGTSDWSDTLSFTTTLSPPLPPTLSLPIDGATGVSTSPTLSWNASSGATSYTLQVSENNDLSSPVFDGDVGNVTSKQVSGLAGETTHYWRVNASNSAGTSDWSDTLSFTTTLPLPLPPTLSSPSDGATGVSTSPTLSWNASSSATSYTLQVSENNDLSSPVFDGDVGNVTSKEISGLSGETTYYWRVSASNSAGTSDWSDTWSFATAPSEKVALTIPDTSANAGETIGIPIRMTAPTGVSIGIVQFVIDYNSDVLEFQSATVGAGATGFQVANVNTNLPFSPSTSGTNENVLVQVSGGGTNSITGENKEVVKLNFLVVGTLGDTSLVAFDQATDRTNLSTTDLQTISGSDIEFSDGEFTIPLEGSCPPPTWSVNPANYSNSMTMTAELIIYEEVSSDPSDIVGVFVEEECRGLALGILFSPTGEYIFSLTIYSNTSGETLTFKAWDNSECEVYDIGETYTFVPDANVGDGLSPFQLNYPPVWVEQTINLNAGWTWFSLYVDPANAAIDSVLKSLTPAQGDIIKSQTQFANYYESYGWYGNLEAIDINEMYMINLSSADLLSVSGTPIDCASNPINLNVGWSWISYMPQTEMLVNIALTSLTPAQGDVIKSQTEFAIYYDSYGWYSDITMQPGEGYKIKLTSSDVLTYPSGSSKVTSAKVVQADASDLYSSPTWTVNPAGYSNTMTMTVQLSINGVLSADASDMVGVFVGNECRGVANASLFPINDTYIVSLTIYSNTSGETLTFKAWDNSSGLILPVTETSTFTPDLNVGDGLAPFALTAVTANIENEPDVPIDIPLQDDTTPVTVTFTNNSSFSFTPTTGSATGQTLAVNQVADLTVSYPAVSVLNNIVNCYDISLSGVGIEAELKFGYDETIVSGLSIAEENLAVSYYDEPTTSWIMKAGTVDAVNNTITVTTDHFSLWAITDKEEVVSVNETESDVLTEFRLLQNYPNPFNPTTTIEYYLAKMSDVRLDIYSISGQRVKTIVNQKQASGIHAVNWDGTNQYDIPVSSGIYICKIRANTYTKTIKMLLVR
ncbi:SUMF1/EgtB/PvdO family nonheme iron enzyme [candidate division KSB1 bacterium]